MFSPDSPRTSEEGGLISPLITAFFLCAAVLLSAGCRSVPELGSAVRLGLAKEEFPPKVTVVIWNASDAPINIWEPYNSWGWEMLSFDTQDPTTGQIFELERIPTAWTANRPTYHTIKPGDPYRIQCDLGDGTWRAKTGAIHLWKKQLVRVHLRIQESTETGQFRVLVGDAASGWK